MRSWAETLLEELDRLETERLRIGRELSEDLRMGMASQSEAIRRRRGTGVVVMRRDDHDEQVSEELKYDDENNSDNNDDGDTNINNQDEEYELVRTLTIWTWPRADQFVADIRDAIDEIFDQSAMVWQMESDSVGIRH